MPSSFFAAAKQAAQLPQSAVGTTQSNARASSPTANVSFSNLREQPALTEAGSKSQTSLYDAGVKGDRSKHNRVLSWDARLPKLGRTKAESTEKSVRTDDAGSPVDQDIEDFDWYHDSSGDEADLEQQTHSDARPSHSSQRRCCRISSPSVQVVVCVVSFASALAPGVAYYMLPANGSRVVLSVSLFDWSVFATAAVLAYYCLRAVWWLILRAAQRNATPGKLKTVLLIKHLSPWINLVFRAVSILVTELTLLQPHVCEGATTADNCKWVLAWLPNALSAIAICSVVYLVQKIGIQRVAVGFHRSQYADRIAQAKLMEKILEQLNQARKSRKSSAARSKRTEPAKEKSHARRNSAPTPATETWDDWEKRLDTMGSTMLAQSGPDDPLLSQPSESPLTPTPAADAMSIATANEPEDVRHQSHFFDLHMFRPKMPRAGISSKREAQKMARRLFRFLAPNAKVLRIDDFKPYIPSERVREEFFGLIQKVDSSEITKAEFRDAIVKAFKERKNLSFSLNHLEQVLRQLDIISFALVSVINVFIWLLIFNVNVLNVFVSFTSVVFTLTFVFGNSAKNAFESLVLLFIVHPYDIGDKIILDVCTNEVFIVDRIHVMFSVFRRGDGTLVYYPNSLLLTKPIYNTRRSGDMSDTINVDISSDITHAQFVELRAAIGDYLKSEPHDWTGRFEVAPQEFVSNGDKLRIAISAQGKGNFADATRRWTRKSKLMFFVRDVVLRYGIKCNSVHHANGQA
ncbi:hypothetical protein RI367_006005 [Sorochytrium milnesiophthora]